MLFRITTKYYLLSRMIINKLYPIKRILIVVPTIEVFTPFNSSNTDP